MEKIHKINGLTGIRAIAALWVLFYHSTTVFFLPQPFLNTLLDSMDPRVPALASYGFLGVDIFFMLSGFVMSYTYYTHFSKITSVNHWLRNYAHYIIFRLARIYPALLFVFFAGSVLVFTNLTILPSPHLKHFSVFLQSLPTVLTLTYTILLTNIDAFLNAYWSFNSPLWTVSVEWASYIAFPIAVLLTATLRKRELLMIAVFLLVILQLYIYIDPPKPELSSVSFFIFGLHALTRICADFFLGYAGFRIFQEIKPLNNPCYIDFIILITIMLIIILIDYFHTIETLIIALLGVFIFCVALNPPITNKLLANRTMIYLGEISYSVYLVHFIILQLVLKFILTHHLFIYLQQAWYWKVAAFSVFLFSVFVVSVLLYHGVEKPARRVMRKLPGKLGL